MVPDLRMVPCAGSLSPTRVRISVVLPAPLRPTRPIRSPDCTANPAPSNRTRVPASIRRSRAISMTTGEVTGPRLLCLPNFHFEETFRRPTTFVKVPVIRAGHRPVIEIPY